jgi:hypothetical protein
MCMSSMKMMEDAARLIALHPLLRKDQALRSDGLVFAAPTRRCPSRGRRSTA